MANSNLKRALMMAVAVSAALSSASAATTGWNQTGAGPYDYNDTANWVSSAINGIWDSSLTLTAAQTVTTSSDIALAGPMAFSYIGNFALTLRADGTGDRTLTLGGNVTDSTGSTTTVTIGSFTNGQKVVVNLGGASRTFEVTSSGARVLNLRNGITGTNATDGIIKTGAGALEIEAPSTYTGTTVVNAGTFWMGSSAKVQNSDAYANTGGTIRFDSSGSGYTSIARTKSLTLFSGNLTGTAASSTSVNTNDLMGVLTIGGGSSVTMTPTATRNMRFTADSLVRSGSGTVLFRGTNLGVNTLASATIGAANFAFTNAPALSGSGAAGTTTVGIIKNAYGDTVAANSGLGLVTYDSTYGVRLLNTSTEYTSAITDGQSQLDNVRLSNGSGSGATTTLASNTTINSLSFNVTAATSQITVGGAGALTLSSGVIFAQSSGTATTGAEMTINSTLDLNGADGIIFYNTIGTSSGQGGAKMAINGPITNDGGAGLTVAGSGMVEVSGAAANTYTGPTTVNSGLLRLSKSVSNVAVPGDLVINGGTCQNTGNQVANTADIFINYGTLLQKSGATNSGSGASETFRDLMMTGGVFTDGASGTSSGATSLRNATLSGGSWNPTGGHNSTMSGNLALSGGVVTLSGTGSTGYSGGVLTTNDVSISNVASGAYTPIVLNGSSVSTNASKLVLKGNLSFTGNSNTSTVTIDAPTNTKLGTIALDGGRTFTIGDGSAADDVTIVAPLTNNGATVGGLTKSGAGTLRLAGVSTYTGNTAVSAGVLALGAAGSIATSPRIEITAGAAFDTSLQSLVMSGTQTYAFGVDGAGGGSAGLLDAAGLEISAGQVDFATVGTLDDGAYVLATYTSLVGTAFAGVSNLPANYAIDYSYNGNSIALVTIPEPATIALSLMAGACLLARRRCVR